MHLTWWKFYRSTDSTRLLMFCLDIYAQIIIKQENRVSSREDTLEAELKELLVEDSQQKFCVHQI